MTEYSSGSGRYSAWGTNGDGTNFCCKVSDSGGGIDQVKLIGTEDGDELSFLWSATGATVTGALHASVHAIIDANGGADLLTGSAGSGIEDSINGGGGNDVVWAGPGDDWVYGGVGDDELHGEGGSDALLGYSGIDALYGAAGDDTLCVRSSSNADTFSGYTGANVLWAPWDVLTTPPSSTISGSSSVCGSTTWGTSWVSGGTCSYTLTTEPSVCADYPR